MQIQAPLIGCLPLMMVGHFSPLKLSSVRISPSAGLNSTSGFVSPSGETFCARSALVSINAGIVHFSDSGGNRVQVLKSIAPVANGGSFNGSAWCTTPFTAEVEVHSMCTMLSPNFASSNASTPATCVSVTSSSPVSSCNPTPANEASQQKAQ